MQAQVCQPIYNMLCQVCEGHFDAANTIFIPQTDLHMKSGLHDLLEYSSRFIAAASMRASTEQELSIEGVGANPGGTPAVLQGHHGTDVSPPSSPRLRQTTFGATLDFIEALCDASSGLTTFSPVGARYPLSCRPPLCRKLARCPTLQYLHAWIAAVRF